MEYAKNTVIAFLMLVVALSAGCASKAPEKSSDKVALDFRPGVVAIRAIWDDESIQQGFGFIVGEKDGSLFIATANHVLRDSYAEAKAESIEVKLFQRPDLGTLTGNLLGVSDLEHDVGAFTIQKPDGFSWGREVLARNRVKRGTEVRFIGRNGKWEIPVIAGRVQQRLGSILEIQGLTSAASGTSGAPLLSPGGLVGMVVEDSQQSTTVVAIQTVEDVLNNQLPWGLRQVAKEEGDNSTLWKLLGGAAGIAVLTLLDNGDSNTPSTGSISVTSEIP